MIDTFAGFGAGLESPATRALPVTPSDSSDLNFVSRALNVATAGTVRVTTYGGDIQSVYVAAGVPFPLRVHRVWATGTSATGIVALF